MPGNSSTSTCNNQQGGSLTQASLFSGLNKIPASQTNGVMSNYQQQLAENFHTAVDVWKNTLIAGLVRYELIRKRRYLSARIRKKQVAQIHAALQKNLHYSLLYNELYKIFSQIEPTGFWGRPSQLHTLLKDALTNYEKNVVPAAQAIESRNEILHEQWKSTFSQHAQASSQVNDLADENASLKKECENLNNQLTASRTREDGLAKAKANVDNQLKGAQSANEALLAEVANKNQIITDLKAKNKEHISEKLALQQKLQKLKQKKQEMMSFANQIGQECDKLEQTNEANELHKQQHKDAINKITELEVEIAIIMAYLNEEGKKRHAAEESLRHSEVQLKHEKTRFQKLISFIEQLIKSWTGKLFTGFSQDQQQEYDSIINDKPSIAYSVIEHRPVTRKDIQIAHEIKQKCATNATVPASTKQSTLISMFSSVLTTISEFNSPLGSSTNNGEFPPAVPVRNSIKY